MWGQLTFSGGRSHSPLSTQARYARVVTSVRSMQKRERVTSCGGFASGVRSRAPMNILPPAMETMPSGQATVETAAELRGAALGAGAGVEAAAALSAGGGAED